MKKIKSFFDYIVNHNFTQIIVILLTIIIFIFPLLPINYPTDIYPLKLLGLKQYANKWFLPNGRTIGIAYLYLFDALNVDIDTYIIISKIIAIIIATICIKTFYSILIHNNASCNNHKVTSLLFSLLLFLNHGTYTFFYYPESGIMWLGILFVILAIKSFFSSNKLRYLFVFLHIFLAMNCYQSIIYFYVPAILAISYTNKDTIKDIFLKTFKNSLLVLVSLVLGYCMILYFRASYNVEILFPIIFRFDFEIILSFLIKALFTYSEGLHNIVITVTNSFILLYWFIKYKTNKIESNGAPFMFNLFLIIFISLVEVWMTSALTNYYFVDRIQIAYIFSWIIALIFIVFNSSLVDNKEMKVNVFLNILILLSIFNVHNYIHDYHTTISNKDAIVQQVKVMIQQYENKSDTKITKIYWCCDKNFSLYDNNTRPAVENCSKRIGGWNTDYALKYYFGINLEVVEDNSLLKSVFRNKNWDSFDKEQLIFEGDTLYWCMY